MADSDLSEPDGEAGSATAKGAVDREELTRRELTVARRLAEAKATIPHGYATRRISGLGDAIGLSALAAAAGTALREHPGVNGAYRDAAIERYSRINVAVTVETDEGPLAPTLFDADAMEPQGIAEELGELTQLARAGELTSAQTAGATHTVSAVQGADAFAGAVTPGQAAHLCIATAVAGDAASLTLCFDLRALRPHEATAYLGSVAALLEDAAQLDS